MLASLDRTHALCATVSVHHRASRSTGVEMRTHELAKRGAVSAAVPSIDSALRQKGVTGLHDLVLSSSYN